MALANIASSAGMKNRNLIVHLSHHPFWLGALPRFGAPGRSDGAHRWLGRILHFRGTEEFLPVSKQPGDGALQSKDHLSVPRSAGGAARQLEEATLRSKRRRS